MSGTTGPVALGMTNQKGEPLPIPSTQTSLHQLSVSRTSDPRVPGPESHQKEEQMVVSKDCVTLDKSLGFSEPQSPYLKRWSDNLGFAG